VFLTPTSRDKGPMTDWIVHFYCPKVPLSIGTTLGALGWLVLKSVFHTPGSEPPITLTPKLSLYEIVNQIRNGPRTT
jgi:hypothetical protein